MSLKKFKLKSIKLGIFALLVVLVSIVGASTLGNLKNKNENEKIAQKSSETLVRVPKQVGLPSGTISSSKDQKAEAGHHHGHGFGGLGLEHGHHGHGHYGGHDNYFQYAHNPAPYEYEFGYRRGNDYHFTERYEKGYPYGHFKTKVKWGDKYAGYGEHYWDYNHADKGYDGGHGHGHDDGHGHGHGHYSEQVPVYESLEDKEASEKSVKKRESKRKPKNSPNSPNLQKSESAQISPPPIKILQNENEQSSKGDNEPAASAPLLSLDMTSGKVKDERTGKTYWLHPTRN